MSFQLFDRISAFFRNTNIYKQQNLFTDQHSLDKVFAAEHLFGNNGKSLLKHTNLQLNRLERYKDYDQMDQIAEISKSLDIFADEASLIDPEIKHSIQVKAKNKRIKEEIEDLFYNILLLDHELWPIARYLCKFGDFPAEIITNQNRNGVASIKFMDVYNFTRVETKFNDLIGFFYNDPAGAEPEFLNPWQVVHMRLTSFESTTHPYGQSALNGARKHYKQLRLMEDAAIVHRLERAPEKRVFTIPVGNIPAHEVPQYLSLVAKQFKKKQFFDPASGEISEKYNPLIANDDIWLPSRPDGTGPQLNLLKGQDSFDKMEDVEYFKKKIANGLKIPLSRLGIGDSSESDSKSLSASSPEFAKAVQRIQREIAAGLKKIAIIHLALRGFSSEDIKNFDIFMTASSSIDELYRIETWASRANVISQLKDTGMFTDEWIMERFTNLSRDEIKEIGEKLSKNTTDMMGGADGMGGNSEMGGLPGMGGMTEDYIKKEKIMMEQYNKVFNDVKKEKIEEEKLDSKFDNYLIKNELDGLQDIDGNIIIERSVDENLFTESKEQFKQFIISEQNIEDILDDNEICEDDIPI